MKKTLLLITLVLSLVLSMAACSTDNAPNKDGATEPQTEAQTEAPLTLDQKKDLIKQEVIVLMGDESVDPREDPAKLLDAFSGDFKLSDLSSDYEQAELPSVIWKKGDVLVDEYADEIAYTVLKDGVVYYIGEGENGGYECYGSYENDMPLTILSYFGIDLSMFTDNDEGMTDIPELKAEDLTVSDDLTVCTISETYLKAMAKSLCESMDYTEDEITAFMTAFEGEGSYNVAEKKLLIELSGKSNTTGDLKVTVAASTNLNDGLAFSMKAEMVMPQGDFEVPTTIEMGYKNVKYNGNKVVSGAMYYNISATVEIDDGEGGKITSASTQSMEISINCENADKPILTYTDEDKTVVTGEPDEVYKQELKLDLSKSEDCFYYAATYGDQSMSATSDNLVLGTPDNTVPAEVLAAAVPEQN